MTQNQIEIWTDGSTAGKNPSKVGGWGAIIVGKHVNDGHQYRAICDYYYDGSSERSELYAALCSLEKIADPARITLVTDCEYVRRGIANLQRGRMPKANSWLWQKMQPLVSMHQVTTEHVKGHSGVDLNEWADRLAYNAAANEISVEEYHDCIPGIRKYIPARS